MPAASTQPTEVAAGADAASTQTNEVAVGADAAGAPRVAAPDTSQKRAARRAARMAKHQAFSFDGLRSHLKEK